MPKSANSNKTAMPDCSDAEYDMAVVLLCATLNTTAANELGVSLEDIERFGSPVICPAPELASKKTKQLQELTELGEASGLQTSKSKSSSVDSISDNFDLRRSSIGSYSDEANELVWQLHEYQRKVDELTQIILSYKSQCLAKKLTRNERVLLSDLFMALRKLNKNEYERMIADYNSSHGPPGAGIINGST